MIKAIIAKIKEKFEETNCINTGETIVSNLIKEKYGKQNLIYNIYIPRNDTSVFENIKIDFLLFTKNKIYLIEVKDINGDIIYKNKTYGKVECVLPHRNRDLSLFHQTKQKEKFFRKYFNIEKDSTLIQSVVLFIKKPKFINNVSGTQHNNILVETTSTILEKINQETSKIGYSQTQLKSKIKEKALKLRDLDGKKLAKHQEEFKKWGRQ